MAVPYQRILSAAALLLLGTPVSPQTVLSLEEASRRQPQSFVAVHDGERVTLQGTIAAPPVQIRDYTHVIIQDDKAFGFTLEFTSPLPAPISSGDVVRASGVITHRSGLAVLRVDSFEKNGALRPPAVA